MDEIDQLVATLPIYYSSKLEPNIQLHQFPLLSRPLQAPPSAASSGKCIRARVKPNARRLEVHIPFDTRPEVWNEEKGRTFGSARVLDDRQKNQEVVKATQDEGEEPRLEDIRLQSEQIAHKNLYMLGIVRDGQLHLHPISETHQLRPTLTYLDALSRKGRRRFGVGSGSDSDDGPPPDPDEPAPTSASPPKQDKRLADAKEAQVSTRRAEDKSNLLYSQGGLTSVRREMLLALRTEEEENWEQLDFYDATTPQSESAFDPLFASSSDQLSCATGMTSLLSDTPGLYGRGTRGRTDNYQS